MKSAEQVKSDLVRQWVAKAREDLGVAEHLTREKTPYLTTIGFHCQQAAEKLMKAILVAHQVPFPKTHDLEELLRLLSTVNEGLAAALADVGELNPYSVEFRYPGDAPGVTPDEASTALAIALKTQELIIAALEDSGVSSENPRDTDS